MRDEQQQRRSLLSAALAVLNERERRIFEARHLADEPATLQRLGDEFGLTRERVRQIEMASLEKVKAAIKRQVEA